MIDEKKLIEVLKEEIQWMEKQNMHYFEQGNFHSANIMREKIQVMKLIVKVIEKQPKTGWIPCEEMLPSKEGFYLVTVKKECELKVLCLWYKKEYWLCYQEETGKIIAWQPLPEPYKKEGAENE